MQNQDSLEAAQHWKEINTDYNTSIVSDGLKQGDPKEKATELQNLAAHLISHTL